MRQLDVYQDGADFYLNESVENAHLFRAPIRVADFDMAAAEQARAIFLDWCLVNDIEPFFG